MGSPQHACEVSHADGSLEKEPLSGAGKLGIGDQDIGFSVAAMSLRHLRKSSLLCWHWLGIFRSIPHLLKTVENPDHAL
jgi:hypothetical protein